jgi:hypothetical protein
VSYLKIYFETASIYENTKVTILPKVASTITREFLSADSSYSNGFLKVLGQFFVDFIIQLPAAFRNLFVWLPKISRNSFVIALSAFKIL